MQRKGNLSALLVGTQTGVAIVENSKEFPQKIKMELPVDPAIPLLGIYPKNPKSPIQKNLCSPMFIAVPFTITGCRKQSKCPSVNEWIKKLVQLQNGILHSRKTKGTPTICHSMGGTGEYYAKWNKLVNERQIPHDLTYGQMESPMESNGQNKLMNKTEQQPWKHETDWIWPKEKRGEGDNDGRKGKGLVKAYVWMTHRRGQECRN